VIKEGHTLVVRVHDLRRQVTADDRAEGAAGARLGQGFVGWGVSVYFRLMPLGGGGPGVIPFEVFESCGFAAHALSVATRETPAASPPRARMSGVRRMP
jgi:hypothetical protein